MYRHRPLQDPPKFTQIGIFGLNIYHLATLQPMLPGQYHLKKSTRHQEPIKSAACQFQINLLISIQCSSFLA
jgi:hypothetical protein